MGVTCAKCGEPLMGAVNRCWKCGQYVLSTPDAANAPPQRRTPVALDSSDDEVAESPTVGPNEQEVAQRPHSVQPPLQVTNPAPLRPVEDIAPARASDYRKGGWNSWLAVASVVLGLLSILGGGFSGFMIVFAGIGLACGILSMQSRRRNLAIAGLLLCLAGTTISSTRLAYDTFVFLRGESPVPSDDNVDQYLMDPMNSSGEWESTDPVEFE